MVFARDMDACAVTLFVQSNDPLKSFVAWYLNWTACEGIKANDIDAGPDTAGQISILKPLITNLPCTCETLRDPTLPDDVERNHPEDLIYGTLNWG